MADIPEITWFDESEKTDIDLDALTLTRFNIKNFTDTHHLQNYYVFKISDPDKESKTGFYGMCIQKKFAEIIKNNLEAWNRMKK